MATIHQVFVLDRAKKQLEKAPPQVKTKFLLWLKSVQEHGIFEVRKRSSWHDEPLKGDRKGQRSIRLNIQWRAIYVLKDDGSLEFVEITEVTPHDY